MRRRGLARASVGEALGRNDNRAQKNESEAGRVASQARERGGTKGGKVGPSCLSSMRPGAGRFIAGAIRMKQVYFGKTGELKRGKRETNGAREWKTSYKLIVLLDRR